MPLYMDIHLIDTDQLLAEDVAIAHTKDLEVEDKYGVKQLKYWIDTNNKKVFCLMKGPDKEACIAVHVESHGMTACNIVELTEDETNLLLLGNRKNDLAYAESGELDSGFRTLLQVDFLDIKGSSSLIHSLKKIILDNHGHPLPQPEDYLLAQFHSPLNALTCTQQIRKTFRSLPDSVKYTIGLATGQLLDKSSETLFDEEKKKLQCLARLGVDNTVYIDHTTANFLKNESKEVESQLKNYQILSDSDVLFLQKVWSFIEAKMSDTGFSVAGLNRHLGLSRSSTYRSIKSILGISPTDLIQNIRFKQAMRLLTQSPMTVAEIAYQVGFNSPSYFTRAFKKRYNVLPSNHKE